MAAGWSSVQVSPAEIRLTGQSAALTLNGIAQGAVTDRIAALLRSHGLQDVLVDMGEAMALGERTPGTPWQAGIAAPDGTLLQRLTLSGPGACHLAPYAPIYGGQGDSAHILPPDSSHKLRQKLVSVSAPSAALADGLSTALCLLADADIQRRLPGSPAPGWRPACPSPDPGDSCKIEQTGSAWLCWPGVLRVCCELFKREEAPKAPESS